MKTAATSVSPKDIENTNIKQRECNAFSYLTQRFLENITIFLLVYGTIKDPKWQNTHLKVAVTPSESMSKKPETF